MFKAPTEAGLPHFLTLLDDIPAPLPKLAKHLGVSVSTIKRWKREEQAPRTAALALFWETRWGASHTYTSIYNDASRHAQHAASLLRYVERLEQQILTLQTERKEMLKSIQQWPANDPIANLGATNIRHVMRMR